MAITGTFLADFTNFNTAVQKAEGELRSFEKQSDKVGTSLTQMTTGSERDLTRVAAATTRTGTAFGALRTGLSQVDKTLGALGIHLGPQIQALGELGDVAGKTAKQLGTIATAGAALGAGIAGWQIGRAIAQFFDLDRKIGDATAKLLGFGDVAAQTAGARMDVLARASATAGRTITDFNEAMEINRTKVRAFQESLNTSANRVALWNEELQKVRAAGHLEALKRDLAAQHSTLEELAQQYHVSTRALEYLQRQQQAAAKADKERLATRTAAARAAAAALADEQRQAEALARDYAKMLSDTANDLGLVQMAAARAAMGLEAMAAAERDFSTTVPVIESMTDALEQANAVISPEQWEAWGRTGRTEVTGLARAVDDAMQFMSRSVSQQFADMLVGLQSFKDGFLGIWNAIRQAFANILADMLSAFLEGFLKKMLTQMAAARLGTAAAGVAMSVGTATASGVAGGVATGGGAAAAGGAGGAGGAGLLSNPAFWSNPYTAIAIGTIVTSMLVWKKGLFRGGEEATKVNPARDLFFQNYQKLYGGSQFEALQRAFAGKGISGDIARQLIANLYAADTMKEFEAATKAITETLGRGGGLRRDNQWHVTLQAGAIAIDGADKSAKEIAREIAPAMVDVILRENPDGSRTRLRRGLVA